MIRALSLLALASQLAVAHTETIHGAVIFSRHGDRNWKGDPSTKLTTVGQKQVYNSGQYWRSRYLESDSPYRIAGISEDTYNAAQLSAACPNQPLLVTTGQVFLQGLYPPVASISETLANGTKLQAPLDGYQYAPLTTVPTDSPTTIWLKGDDGCSAFDDRSSQWKTTSEFKALEESTKDFYMSFYDKIFAGVLPASKMSYENAFTIFDYINVGVVHNATISDLISKEQLFQLRTLADSAEWAQSGAVSSPQDALAVSGRTLSGKVLKQLEDVISSKGTKTMLSLNVGSYDTFLAFFGLTGLPKVDANFYGLPDYASTLAFELLSSTEDNNGFPEEEDLLVRFLFRNGTESGPAQAYPLFGDRRLMTWKQFKDGMSEIALGSVEEWCNLCDATVDYCRQYSNSASSSPASSASNGGDSGEVTPAVAGVIGAMVMLGVLSIAAAIAVIAGVRISRRTQKAATGKSVDEASSYATSL